MYKLWSKLVLWHYNYCSHHFIAKTVDEDGIGWCPACRMHEQLEEIEDAHRAEQRIKKAIEVLK